MLRIYVRIWLMVTLFLAYEAVVLNHAPHLSVLGQLTRIGVLARDFDLSPAPGKRLSLWLGWMGIGVMLLTNLYSFRKRAPRLRKLGRMSGWLDFHIFCGLMGPTLVLFHTNFRVGGLVAVSFWSMVISFASGIVGRYFYLQVLRQKSELEHELAEWDKKVHAAGGVASAIEQARAEMLAIAGADAGAATGALAAPTALSLTATIVNSIKGDLRLWFRWHSVHGMSVETRVALVGYAVARRRILHLDQFRRVMGYWHTFHMPFAVFMYVVAAIHIAAALILQT